VTVYDMQGRIVKNLMNGFRATGQQTSVGRLQRRKCQGAGRIYFVRIQAPEGSVIQRVTVLK
jgi:hypothetical protein